MTFQRVLENYMKPPFKYFIVPRGFITGDFYYFNSLAKAKAKAEELAMKHKQTMEILNVFKSTDKYRSGWMSNKILYLDHHDFEWSYYEGSFCLHTAFFFTESAICNWNRRKFSSLKRKWKKGKFGDPFKED